MAVQTTCKFPQYINTDYGPIGKAASTREHPNTAQYFNFWLSAGVDPLTPSPRTALQMPVDLGLNGTTRYSATVGCTYSSKVPKGATFKH